MVKSNNSIGRIMETHKHCSITDVILKALTDTEALYQKTKSLHQKLAPIFC